jgi:hypothetical protein
MVDNLPVEFQLLLRCCTTALHNDTGPITVFFEKHHPDWNRFLKLTQHHKLIPVVNRVLSEIPEYVPPEILSTLGELSGRSLKRMMNLNSELQKIHRIFESAALPFIPLKGPVMVKQLYGDYASRQTRDLDVLVQPERLVSAISLLSENGFILQDEYFIKNPEKRRLYMMRENHVRFSHPHKKIIVELHWAVSRNFTTPSTDYWFKHAIPIEIEGRQFRTFPVEDYFVILATHGIYHQYELLFWLYDIAHLVKNSAASRKSLTDHAMELKCVSAAKVSIALAGNLFGINREHVTAQISLTQRDRFLYHQCIKKLSENPHKKEPRFHPRIIRSLQRRLTEQAHFLLMTNTWHSRSRAFINMLIKPYVWKEEDILPLNNLVYLFMTQLKWLKMLISGKISRGGRIRKGRRTVPFI